MHTLRYPLFRHTRSSDAVLTVGFSPAGFLFLFDFISVKSVAFIFFVYLALFIWFEQVFSSFIDCLILCVCLKIPCKMIFYQIIFYVTSLSPNKLGHNNIQTSHVLINLMHNTLPQRFVREICLNFEGDFYPKISAVSKLSSGSSDA